MAGTLYVIVTLVFFTLATISISLDLAWRSLGGTNDDFSTQISTEVGPYYIFVIAGMLSDAMMIHRCYRLWNSRKSVIILPLLGLIGISITWIVFEAMAVKSSTSEEEQFSTASVTAMFTSQIYGSVTLAENIVLTGLMAGRVWWLERRMKTILIVGKNKPKISQSLLGPILQSGALNPIFLSIWVAAAYSPALDSVQLLTPCALTQIVGISSTLIVLSIGIGLASDSRSRVFDEENQSSEDREESDLSTKTMQTSICPSPDTIQPFTLTHGHDDSVREPLRPKKYS
ncbi:hypothetical protein BDP27DRAFT_1336803 [Rhodocollybia butyracea]|uniref:Uncharacterized protein n=1 Tax=Rhodocollybia butyracea TaxID=206335 RepID=A0A9P5U272_9AGAR|nr:hypothetical protein BDP27DRAFT_1336803 [Rhodocollybia butyracea]